MLAQLVGVFGDGAEPPPDSSEPSRNCVICALFTDARSACVICPIFSSSVIRLIRSLTRVATGKLGSLYGCAVAAPGASTAAATTPSAAHRTNGRSALDSSNIADSFECGELPPGREYAAPLAVA